MFKANTVGPTVGPVRRFIGRTWLKVFGWQLDGVAPEVPSAVYLANPHTTGWDVPFMVAASWAFNMKPSWAGKDSLFRFPFGTFMRAVGGTPIDRSKRGNQVQRIAETIRKEDRMYLVIAPAGTRSKRDHWKSGFYHIASEANVPILLAYLDYGRRVAGFGPAIWPTGNVRADMDKIRAFYRGIDGKYPDRHSTPVLKEELTMAMSMTPAVAMG